MECLSFHMGNDIMGQDDLGEGPTANTEIAVQFAKGGGPRTIVLGLRSTGKVSRLAAFFPRGGTRKCES